MSEGWFPDPTGKPQERYWNGSEWTEETRGYPPPSPKAPDRSLPAAEAGPATPTPAPGPRPLLVGAIIVLVLLTVVGGLVLWRTNVDNAAREAAREGAALGGSKFSMDFNSSDLASPFLSVTYEVSAVGYQEDDWEPDASITYETPTGTEQSDVDDGWSRTFTFEQGAFVYLSAQNLTEGYVSCRITVEGTSIANNTARGLFKIASCDGSAR